MHGYIKLHRQIIDHWLWSDKPYSNGQAWMDLVMLANHKLKKIHLKGSLITVQRGQLAWSMVALGARWGWNDKRVARFLKLLESDEQVSRSSGRITSVITITNYDQFQSDVDEVSNSRRANVEQTSKDKNGENEKKSSTVLRTVERRTREAAKRYFAELGYASYADPFWDHYESNGWMQNRGKPIKDWKAAARNWIRRQKDFTPESNERSPLRGDGLRGEAAERERVRARIVKEMGIRDDDTLKRMVDIEMEARSRNGKQKQD